MINWLKQIFRSNSNSQALTAPDVKNQANKEKYEAVIFDKSQTYANMGEIHFEKGELKEAAECYQRAIAINPSHAAAFCGLGLVLLQQNLPHDAEQSLKQAVSLSPHIAQAYYFLGTISANKGNLNEAIEYFKKALELKPDAEIVYCDLCYALFQSGDQEEAKKTITQGITVNPNFAQFHAFLGNLNYFELDINSAIACYQKAITIQPDAVVYLNLGRIFFEQDKLSDAIACYRQALAINPRFSDAYFNLGLALQNSNIDDAIACHRNVLALEPHHLAARMKLLHLLMQQCDWKNLETHFQDVNLAIIESPVTGSPPPFLFLSLPGITAAEQKLCAEKWAQREYQSIASLGKKLGFEFSYSHHDKISIGYLSSDFREHAVSFLMAEIFELHDRNRFNITAYSYGADDGSALRKRLENAFDKFVDISVSSSADAAKAIANDQIDILVDLTGYTSNNRTAILALRPAPTQVNYLGYAGTMGAEFVDYLIADDFVIPTTHQEYYTEKIVRMPDCFMPCDRTRARPTAPSRTDCGLPESGLVFCSFNNSYKITPEVFSIWCKLLNAVPDSILWLSASIPQVESNLRQEAQNRGVNTDRIIMAAKLDKVEEHLARLQCADLFLDTTPYNAHTTCSDALWMGLPLITCSGETFPSRVAGSLLSAIGVPELITYSLEEYYSLALDLATNQKKLNNIRHKLIANRETTPLFDSKRFTRNLEVAYYQMWERRNSAS